MATKKTLYEILEVATNASCPEIRASYDRLLQALESRQSSLNHEDYKMQLRLLKVAFSTLSSPSSRDSYDAHLMIRGEPASSLATTSAIGAANDPGAAARAEALLMRADAMAIRADALVLKAGLSGAGAGSRYGADANPVGAQMLKSAKTVLMVLGVIVVFGLVLRMVVSATRGVQPSPSVSVVDSAKEEARYLQEYYQTWGVRPASRAEAELLDAERRKNEEAKQAQRDKDEAARRTAQDQQRFEADARQRGERARADLESSEMRARQAALEEDRQQALEKERKAAMEAQRKYDEAAEANYQRIIRMSGAKK